MSDPSPPNTASKRARSSSPDADATSATIKKAKEDPGASPVAAAAAVPETTEGSAGNGDAENTLVGEEVKEEEGAQEEKGEEEGKMDEEHAEGAEGAAASNPPSSVPSAPVKAAEAPVQQISMRCLIVTQDASIIIGRNGVHVNEIRDKSSARVTISESIPGNPERILNVSGQLDAVAKAFGLIVRRINDEPFDVASVPGSRAVTIKFIIPNSRMGSVIGKGGSKIKEIQEASGARLNASEAMLPGSTERVLSISGVADAIHIAVYYVGTILLEYQERNPGSMSGTYRQNSGPRSSNAQGNGASAPGAQTQQIYIPNSLVGAIIGKGGAKINEIRSQSNCQIRVTDPGTGPVPGQPGNPDERLVMITGQPHNINIAVQLLYSRLEAEKTKSMAPM